SSVLRGGDGVPVRFIRFGGTGFQTEETPARILVLIRHFFDFGGVFHFGGIRSGRRQFRGSGRLRTRGGLRLERIRRGEIHQGKIGQEKVFARGSLGFGKAGGRRWLGSPSLAEGEVAE